MSNRTVNEINTYNWMYKLFLYKFQLKKGETLLIPVYDIHHDGNYYPDPEKFNPYRFNEENKLKIKPFTYLPFGVGPRNCIGMHI